LYVLLWLYTLALSVRWVVVRLDRSGAFRARIDRLTELVARSHAAPLVLAVPLLVSLWFASPWYHYFGIPPADMNLIVNAQALTAFGTAFAFGWLVHRQIGVLEVWTHRWRQNLIVAVVLSIACLTLVGPTPITTPAAQLGLDTCDRRGCAAFLLERKSSTSLCRGRFVLDLPDPRTARHGIANARGAVAAAVVHQVRGGPRGRIPDHAGYLSVAGSIHLRRHDPQRPALPRSREGRRHRTSPGDLIMSAPLTTVTAEEDLAYLRNLPVQLRKLEEAGYVTIEKSSLDRKPLTRARVTAAGVKAFRRYLDTMTTLVRSVPTR
jgi:hypothetical protein